VVPLLTRCRAAPQKKRTSIKKNPLAPFEPKLQAIEITGLAKTAANKEIFLARAGANCHEAISQ
jgi:hypothetical protein